MLIGLAGYAQVGKDEVAKILVGQGFTRFAFADKLKDLATRLHYWSGSKDELGRLHLQYLGDQARQVLGDDVWVRAVMSDISHLDNVVISDVRYKNEVEAIQQAGGRVLRVIRHGKPANGHISEALPEISSIYDGYIKNTKTLDELYRQVVQWVLIESN